MCEREREKERERDCERERLREREVMRKSTALIDNGKNFDFVISICNFSQF